jgi:hypothetical protein
MPLYDPSDEERNTFAPVGHAPGTMMHETPEEKAARTMGPPKPAPTWGELASAGFGRENDVLNVARMMKPGLDFGEIDRTHNPLDAIKDDPEIAEYSHLFLGSRNQRETDYIRERVRKEVDQHKTLSEGGAAGVAMSIVASLASPTTLLPGASIYKGLKGGIGVGRSMAQSAGLAAGGMAAQEAALHANQLTRTKTESAVAISTAALVGTLLGGAASKIASHEMEAVTKAVQKAWDDTTASLAARADGHVPTEMGTPGPKAAGAGVNVGPQPAVALENAAGLDYIPGIGNGGPGIRGIKSPSLSAREGTAGLVEVPVGLTRNKLGFDTAPNGTVEGSVKEGMGQLWKAVNGVNKAFAEHVAKTKDGAERLGHREFIEEVGRALARGDKHDLIPEVAAAAKHARELLDLYGQKAVDLGQIPQEVFEAGKPATAKKGIGKDKPPQRPDPATPKGQEYGEIEKIVKHLDDTEPGTEPGVKGQGDPHAIHEATETLQRVNPDLLDKIKRAWARFSGGVTDSEIAEVKRNWEFVESMKGVKPAERMTSWVRSGGGLKDPFGDVKAIIGSTKEHPFIINNKSGMTLDDAALRAWEQGFIQGSERPTIREFLEVLEEDVKGVSVVRGADSQLMEEVDRAAQIRTELEQVGVGKAKNSVDAVRQFIDARAAKGGAKEAPELLADVRKAVDEALNHPSAAPPLEELKPEIAARVWGIKDIVQTYAPRIYNRVKIIAERPKFNAILTDYFARGQARAENVLAELRRHDATKAMDRDIEALEKFVRMDRQELSQWADDTIDAILGHANDGRLLFELPAAARGPLKERTLRIPDELIEDYLERNVETMLHHYVRTLAPDLALIEKFGDIEMTELKSRIRGEFSRLAAATPSEKQKAKLDKQLRSTIEDLDLMRDRLRGTAGQPANPDAWTPRVMRVIRELNFVSMLGNMTISALSDVARPIMVHGVTSTMGDGWLQLITNLKAWRMAGEETKLAGAALEMSHANRQLSLADIGDPYQRLSKLERASHYVAEKFSAATLMRPWNVFHQQMAGTISMTNMLRTATKAAAGNASDAEIRKLGQSSLGGHVKTIAEQMEKHGEVQGRVWLPNTEAWDISDPTVKAARSALRQAIARDVDRIIVKPGAGDLPSWASTEVGKTLGQFQSFNVASMQKTVLAGLQERDAGVAMGLMGMMAIGALSVKLRNLANGREDPATPEQWALEAANASGIFAWLFEVDNLVTKLSAGHVGMGPAVGRPLNKFHERNVMGSLMGPTFGQGENVLRLIQTMSRYAAGDQISDGDIRAARKLIPFQNLFYTSWIMRQLEAGAAGMTGAKDTGVLAREGVR